MKHPRAWPGPTALVLAFPLAFVLAVPLAACGPRSDPLSVPVTPVDAAAASASPPTAAPAPRAEVNDLAVTENVKTALLRSSLLQGTEIAVVVLKGDVRLTGALDSQSQIDEALRIARASDGAHSIHNELTLRTP
jgi:hyperosmotically inducible protein